MGSSSEKIYNYLFKNDIFPYKNKWFNSFIIKINNKIDNIAVINALEEIFLRVEVIKTSEEIIFVYFDEIDFSLKDVISSIEDDVGEAIFAFNMPKIFTNSEKFSRLFEMYRKYFSSKNQGYFEMSDLILETISKNIKDTILVKEIILEKILSDPQNEKLIMEIFNNNLNVLKTSKGIYMHRNTINNRLDIIKKETGLNIQKFKDAVAMYSLMKIK